MRNLYQSKFTIQRGLTHMKLFKDLKKETKLKPLISALIITTLLSGCGSSTSNSATDSTEISTETTTLDGTSVYESPDKSLDYFIDLFSSPKSDNNSATNDDNSDNNTHTHPDSDIQSDSTNANTVAVYPSNYLSEKNANNYINKDTNTYSHTIMIYMVGSDLESQYGNATIDFTEMLSACPDTNKHNIAIFTGGATDWQISEIDASHSYLLEIANSDLKIKDTYDLYNMGDPNTLSNFINYCYDEYDTDKYSLILWNHGAGPVVGFGLDENYTDILTVPELESALSKSVGQHQKLDLIGFDACLMSSLEIASVLSPYADYMVASQETEPGWGWNYEFLSSLSNPGINGAGLGVSIVDAYYAYCEEMFDKNNKYYADVTMSCLDLSKCTEAEASFDTFINDINTTLSSETFPSVIRTRNGLKNFGSYSTDFNYSMVDSMELINQYSNESNASTAKAALEALDNLILYEKSNVTDANGLSVCFPYNTDDTYAKAYLSISEATDFSPGFRTFLNNVYALENGETIATNWNETNLEATIEDTEIVQNNVTYDGKDISLQLTDEQQKNFSKANFYILAKAANFNYKITDNDSRAEDLYFYVYAGKNVPIDENGILHACYDNNILYMKGTDSEGNEEISHLPMILIDDNIGDTNTAEKRYLSYALLQSLTDDFLDYDCIAANLQIVRDKEHPDGYIRNAVPLDDDEENSINTPSKQLIDIYDYNLIAVTSSSARYLTKDDKGNILPYFEWEDSGSIMGFETYTYNGIEFIAQSIPDPENYAAMFVVYDSQGNATASELIPLNEN